MPRLCPRGARKAQSASTPSAGTHRLSRLLPGCHMVETTPCQTKQTTALAAGVSVERCIASSSRTLHFWQGRFGRWCRTNLKIEQHSQGCGHESPHLLLTINFQGAFPGTAEHAWEDKGLHAYLGKRVEFAGGVQLQIPSPTPATTSDAERLASGSGLRRQSDKRIRSTP